MTFVSLRDASTGGQALPLHQAAASSADAFESTRRKAYRAVTRSNWNRAEQLFSALSTDRRTEADDLLALAKIRIRVGKYEEAWQAAQRVLGSEPDHAQAAHLGSLALILQHRWADALPLFERHASGPAREHCPFVVNHGTTLAALGRPQQALPVLLEAMPMDLTDSTIHMKVGLVLRDLKMFEEAAESFVTAATLDPKRITARMMSLHMRQHACQWKDFASDCNAVLTGLRADSTDWLKEGGVFTLTAIEHPALLLRHAAVQAEGRYPQLETLLPKRSLTKRDSGRLRVGYVSSDFYNHATAVLFVEALEMHDRQRFEVTLYSHSKDDGSPLEQRIRSACERFVDISGLCDAQAASRIHADEIDILVDLKGHTQDNRLGIFAWRPAPLQVSFLGFPGTTGARHIDYLIGDPWVTPLEHADRYSEKIAQMPVCYQPNDSLRERPEGLRKAQAGLPEDKLVLACFNQAFKITPAAFEVWMGILRAVPNSVLWMLEDNEQATANLRREAVASGIAADRLFVAPRLPVARHLARLPAADLVLDNWPYNAHTTAGDVLWMGVPIVTLEGDSFASRVAGSLLRSVGLEELVCQTTQQYSDLVIDLLNDSSRLQQLKRHLEQGRASFSLFDGDRFARDLERLFERMVSRARQGLVACALPAEAPLELHLGSSLSAGNAGEWSDRAVVAQAH